MSVTPHRLLASKFCRWCKTEKPIAQFYLRGDGGIVSVCKDCSNKKGKEWRAGNREDHLARRRAHRKINPAKRYPHLEMKHRYGITVEERDAMEAQQGGLCAICQKPPKSGRLCIDHDHETKKVRGLLCNGCNVAIGMLDDDASRARSAAEYLARTSKCT